MYSQQSVERSEPLQADFVPQMSQRLQIQSDLLQGTLDLILKTLALGSQHGWGISQRIQQVSQDVLQVNQGSLYPSLHRLEEQGWISSEWGMSDSNRQAKSYKLTKRGQRQLDVESANWARISTAVGRILDATS